MLYMPHKFNADRRDKIPKQKRRVTNGADYDERCCQTNAHQPEFSSNLNFLGCAEATPLCKSGGTVQLEI
jgi:hypothetical protein